MQQRKSTNIVLNKNEYLSEKIFNTWEAKLGTDKLIIKNILKFCLHMNWLLYSKLLKMFSNLIFTKKAFKSIIYDILSSIKYCVKILIKKYYKHLYEKVKVKAIRIHIPEDYQITHDLIMFY